jgi:hypothetical protein
MSGKKTRKKKKSVKPEVISFTKEIFDRKFDYPIKQIEDLIANVFPHKRKAKGGQVKSKGYSRGGQFKGTF